jgi:hypothetical protein
MATIEIKVPFEDQPLKVIWGNREVKIKGSKSATLYWKSLTLRGMFGVFGHRVDLKDTELSDVVVALQNLLPPEDISIDREAKTIVERERKQRKPLPDGARS